MGPLDQGGPFPIFVLQPQSVMEEGTGPGCSLTCTEVQGGLVATTDNLIS